ncbi:hypothetical protein B0H10DRAFT_248824 [Mycena sp. CBHHK59/15]|nr:hypothetical protein B0H10DRAFT_248824 [Mycena sp. CBHHK59/15]
MNVLHFCQLAQARLASVPPSAPLLARSDSQQRASASSPDDPVPRMPSCQRDERNFQSKTSTAKQVNRGSSRRRSASHPGGRPTAASNSTAHPGPASMVPDPDRTVRPDDALLDRLDDAVRSRNAHDALDREIAALGSKIDAFTAEKQALLQQVQLEASNAHHVDQHQTPLPALRVSGSCTFIHHIPRPYHRCSPHMWVTTTAICWRTMTARCPWTWQRRYFPLCCWLGRVTLIIRALLSRRLLLSLRISRRST